MRILIVSNLYPPVVHGGYEVECSSVVERLREHHEVSVLTSDLERGRVPASADLYPSLTYLTPDARGAVRAPLAAWRAVRCARRTLAWQPDLIYIWNGAAIPQAALRVFADSGRPLAFRVCEQWFASIFTGDQFLRELLPTSRGPARSTWAAGCRAFNELGALRLQPTAPLRASVSWVSEALRRSSPAPPFIEVMLEQICHPAPANGALFDGIARELAPEPQITFIGSVVESKGVGVAIEALALLRSEHAIAASLLVVGREYGGYGQEMRKLAERLGVAGAVHWYGHATPKEAAAVLGRTDVLIVPSTWEEPFGLVPIEGALARVPLVSSDVGGIGEGMQHELHALLFAGGNAMAAAAALARTLRERTETEARVERAYAHARESFRLDSYLDAQEQFVLDALAAQEPDTPAHRLPVRGTTAPPRTITQYSSTTRDPNDHVLAKALTGTR